jgi:hypothetical protein
MSDPPQLFAFNVTNHPEGGSQVGLVAKRTYEVRNGVCVVSPDQVPLVEVPETSPDGAILRHDVDLVLNRTRVDVIVIGFARSRLARGSFDARVRVAALDRRVRVYGDRRCVRDASGHLRFTTPSPVERVALDWANAYGGVDLAAAKKFGDPYEEYCGAAGQPYDARFGSFAYPRNRAGKGYLIEASDEALESCELPALEDPSQPLTPDTLSIGSIDNWPAGPPVAALGFQAYSTFPRGAMVGLLPPFDDSRYPPESFFEVREGAVDATCLSQTASIGKRMNIGVLQQAAVRMQATEVRPAERVELENIHPRHESWGFELPRELPEMVIRMPDGGNTPLTAKIRTLLLAPESDRVCITWVGEHREPTPVGPGKQAKIRHSVAWRG